MDLQQKLAVLADAAKYDASCASSGSHRVRMEGGLHNTDGVGICHSYTPDGRCVSLLKLLLTNYCLYDCSYCVNRISSDTRRARFTPEEVVFLTVEFYKRNYIEGLFLSSGIIQNADYTMEQLTQVARLLRTEERFGGYIHLKAVPGAAAKLMLEAGRWADRLSANFELAREADLIQLAPAKNHREIEASMREIAHGILNAKDKIMRNGKAPRFAPAGQSTQRLTLSDLGKLKIAMNRARHFIVTADHNPALQLLDAPRLPERLTNRPLQLTLFEAANTARTGEL
ncbi:MAG TPA: hypothetical protein VGK64_21120 [Bryobacteraceae bacterium]